MKSTDSISNIWVVTREYGNLAGAGGVKDVSAQLAEALARTGKKVSVVLPCYGFMQPGKVGFAPLDLQFDVNMSYTHIERREEVHIWMRQSRPAGSGKQGSVTIYLVGADRYTEKHGVYTYTAAEEKMDPGRLQGVGHFDYFAMNILLQKAAVNLMIHLDEKVDVIHCHDGHTAVLPAMIREIEGYAAYFRNTGCLVTVHNAGKGYHQDIDDLAFARAITGLPARVIDENLLDGSFDPLLAAPHYAIMNTVSENYARELQETDEDSLTGWLGHILKGRGIELQGVTNGIDPADFDLSQPGRLGIAASFDPEAGALSGKRECRQEFVGMLQQTSFGHGEWSHILQSGTIKDAAGLALFTFIGRLTAQKGVDKLIEALEVLLPRNKKFAAVILGAGDKRIEQELVALTEKIENQGRICLLRGYDPLVANKIYAAGDFFLIPSQYEPCGLTDYMAQLFGTIPIVHHVGGLVKVVDGSTGFAYWTHSSAALMETMERALHLYRRSPEKILQMQQQAIGLIKTKYTWDTVVQNYAILYKKSLTLRRP